MRSSSPARSQVDSRLYLITGARPDLESFLEAAVRGGVDIVQIREKKLADGELLAALQQAREVTRRLGVPLVVNDRPDLARLVEADYVHVGQDDLPVEAARAFGVDVGQSTHAPPELDATEADYVGVGPVFETPTKEGRPAAGLEYVRYAAAHARATMVRDRRHRRLDGRRRGRRRCASRRRRPRDRRLRRPRTGRRRPAQGSFLEPSGTMPKPSSAADPR